MDDSKTEFGFEPMRQHRGKHARILNQKYFLAAIAVTDAAANVSRMQYHFPSIPPTPSGV
ncbi:hypothetical protein Rhsp01_03370 [Rhizobium sp. NBRC 114257]|uniref:Uncharacterized protein n=1 Tax=Rhizobium dioscoreae TaxID=2653122 RepID=A0ABQ0YZB0_9HYPH|nr:hypothetical protein RsS93_09830 [Rhizobium dioscoreae]GLU79161.1 hypothetical protein Rhsp01_03370 [Rhizobium sp. NBRC 114257]